jgi:hypothetical protein
VTTADTPAIGIRTTIVIGAGSVYMFDTIEPVLFDGTGFLTV